MKYRYLSCCEIGCALESLNVTVPCVHSDDGGYTWSAQRYNVPYPEAPIDRANSFNGKVRIMWSVDQAKVHDGKVMYAFTRIGTYPQGPPEVNCGRNATAHHANLITHLPAHFPYAGNLVSSIPQHAH